MKIEIVLGSRTEHGRVQCYGCGTWLELENDSKLVLVHPCREFNMFGKGKEIDCQNVGKRIVNPLVREEPEL